MTRIGSAALVAALAGLAILSVGCGPTKEQYESLQAEYQDLTLKYNELLQQRNSLQNQLAQTNTQEAGWESERMRLTQQLMAAQAKIAELEQKTGTGPLPPGTVYVETVGADVLFPSGRASLTAAGKRALDGIIGKLRDSYSGMTVRVYGYTDSDPIVKSKKYWQDNLDLSANRAMAVTRYLREKGLDSSRIETIAMGPTNPVAPNKTATGKAKNRRVVIAVVKT